MVNADFSCAKMGSKCCFCFDLRYGYYTYAIVIMGLRISAVCFLYLYLPFICNKKEYACGVYMPAFGWFTGWFVTSIIFCFLAIVGIIQERSIIIYPYIIILVTELFSITMTLLFVSIFLYSLGFVALVALLCFGGYDLWCFISLYKKVKKAESTIGLLSNNYSEEDVV